MDAQDPTSKTYFGTEFRELDRAECMELLAGSAVARIAWCSPDGPHVLPVTATVHDGAVVFRTAAYSALARSVRDATVAVEVDDIDVATQAGWSVVVTGTAEIVLEPDDLVDLWRSDGPEPWAPGVRTLFVRVVPGRVTGRRIAQR